MSVSIEKDSKRSQQEGNRFMRKENDGSFSFIPLPAKMNSCLSPLIKQSKITPKTTRGLAGLATTDLTLLVTKSYHHRTSIGVIARYFIRQKTTSTVVVLGMLGTT